jgi:hypothetical protein
MSSMAFSLCTSQNITGTLRSTYDVPVDYANIVMQTKQDSIFIAGCITDQNGNFSLPLGNNSPENILLSISCLGYESKKIEIKELNIGIITLHDKTEELQEVVIAVRRSPYSMKEGALIANVNSSPLKDVGNATDVLKNMPLVNIKDEDISVFGKGKPLIYINNREVRSNEELEQLNSSQIKNIEVITSPGAKYPATVNAVIRITTLKRDDEGLAGSVYARVAKREEWNENASINLNYNTAKLTLLGTFSLNDIRIRKDQTTVTTIADTDSHQAKDDTKLYADRLAYRTSLGVDYTIRDNHSIGVKYDLSLTGKSKNEMLNDLTYLRNQVQQTKLKNDGYYKDDGENGYLNTYYNGKFGTFDVSLNADYVHGNSIDNALYITTKENNVTEINTKSENNYDLAAVKLDAKKEIGQASLEFGGEYSYTNNRSEYANDSQEMQSDLPNRETKNKQDLFALFIAYRQAWKNFTFYAGLRYEYINFQYYLDRIKKQEQSKTYNQLFPMVSATYSLLDDKVNMSFSYKKTVSRPGYYQLRGDIQYNSPFSYEGGNPALKSSFADDFSYTFSFADFYLNSSFKIFKDQSMFIIEQFGNKPISLATFVNVDNYKELSTSAVWNPTFFKIWNPTLEAGFQKQYLKLVYDNKATKYNKPNVFLSLNNTLKLPKEFTFVIHARYWNAYSSGFSEEKETMCVDARIQKRLLNKALTLVVGMENIFDTYDEKWRMNYKNVSFDKSAKNDNRFVYVSVRYNFNKLKTYRGKGAANEERSRL